MQNASDEDLAFALKSDRKVWSLFTELLNEYGFQIPPNIEYIILDRCNEFISLLCDLKKQYKVERPYKQARKFSIQMPNTYTKSTSGFGYSYPSCHAGQSRFYAHAIAQSLGNNLSDQQRYEIFNLANRIGFARIQLGVHSPQDVREGQRLADQRFGVS
jgi:membrane-associated phospholipid phosphatase